MQTTTTNEPTQGKTSDQILAEIDEFLNKQLEDDIAMIDRLRATGTLVNINLCLPGKLCVVTLGDGYQAAMTAIEKRDRQATKEATFHERYGFGRGFTGFPFQSGPAL
jgi:hypothetical protein